MERTLANFLIVAAILLFGFAGTSWWVAEPWPWREKIIAMGLFCFAFSWYLVSGLMH
jgi:hypothetical protein